MIFEDQEFYEDIEEFVERNEEDIMNGYFSNGVWVKECELRPVYEFKNSSKIDIAELIFETFIEENCPEDLEDQYYNEVKGKLLEALAPVDMEKLTESLPKVYIPTLEKTYYSEIGLKNILKDYLDD